MGDGDLLCCRVGEGCQGGTRSRSFVGHRHWSALPSSLPSGLLPLMSGCAQVGVS